MEMTILHLYPDCMSLYGDWGNVALLSRRLALAGHTVAVKRRSFAETFDLAAVDFVFLGAGTEGMTRAVMADLLPQAEKLRRAAREGLPMLFTGTAFELLGKTVTTAAGETYPALEIAPFTTVQQERRIVGDVLGDCPLIGEKLVGYQNKSSHSIDITAPLLTSCVLGQGNEAPGGAEGICLQQVIGTHLSGPMLVKNPALADWFVQAVCTRRGEALTRPLPKDEHALAAWRMSVELLSRRAENKR